MTTQSVRLPRTAGAIQVEIPAPHKPPWNPPATTDSGVPGYNRAAFSQLRTGAGSAAAPTRCG